jgi:hypothetical protein
MVGTPSVAHLSFGRGNPESRTFQYFGKIAGVGKRSSMLETPLLMYSSRGAESLGDEIRLKTNLDTATDQRGAFRSLCDAVKVPRAAICEGPAVPPSERWQSQSDRQPAERPTWRDHKASKAISRNHSTESNARKVARIDTPNCEYCHKLHCFA